MFSSQGFLKPKRIYLDYAAATPIRQRVRLKMDECLTHIFGNPSAIHKEGQQARKWIEEAREIVARTLRVRATDVTFTGSGTESNNLALFGSVEAWLRSGTSYSDIEIISTRLEHPSILRTLSELERRGVCVKYVPVGEDGRVVFPEFKKILSLKTKLVTFAYANSETGVVEDINRLGRCIREFEKENNTEILFHSDASQAPLWLPCQLESLSLDMMTLDAGKCYGPKGVGVLIHRPKAKLKNVLYGGSQEGGLRPATENTPAIAGAAKAIDIAQRDYEKRSERIKVLRDAFMVELIKIDGVVVNGSTEHRLVNNANISIPGLDSEYAVVVLDNAGVACSTRSACSGSDGTGSHVVREMTKDDTRANSTIRFTLGEETDRQDLLKTAKLLKAHAEKMAEYKNASDY